MDVCLHDAETLRSTMDDPRQYCLKSVDENCQLLLYRFWFFIAATTNNKAEKKNELSPIRAEVLSHLCEKHEIACNCKGRSVRLSILATLTLGC